MKGWDVVEWWEMVSPKCSKEHEIVLRLEVGDLDVCGTYKVLA